MNHQELRTQFDKVRMPEGVDRSIKVRLEQAQERVIAAVSGVDHQQFPRPPAEEVRVAKVSVLGDHYPTLRIGDGHHLVVGRRISVCKLAGVDGVMTGLDQEMGKPLRQLRIDEESHASPSGTSRCPPTVSAPNSNAASRSSRSRSG